MSRFATVDELTLFDALPLCGFSTGSALGLWTCVLGEHGDDRHYFVRAAA